MSHSLAHPVKIDPAVDLIVLDPVFFKIVWKYRFLWRDMEDGHFYNEGSDIPQEIILLPEKRDGLEENFSSIITEDVPKLQMRSVHVKLPRFKFYYSTYFAENLKDMGVMTLFNSESKRFSDLFHQPDLVGGDLLHRM
ncbi:hypothetical protein TNCV_3484181 [Trichonephila clavipes]|nr:hypothetical protein TNCV_3484181 [Trichonephila clavipes]